MGSMCGCECLAVRYALIVFHARLGIKLPKGIDVNLCGPMVKLLNAITTR